MIYVFSYTAVIHFQDLAVNISPTILKVMNEGQEHHKHFTRSNHIMKYVMYMQEISYFYDI
jgi:hypothetical protein